MATMKAASMPSQKFCRMMKNKSGRRLAAEKGRLDEGIADEAAERLDFILHHGGDFRRLDALEHTGREAQHAVDELEAEAAQHALAEPALVGIDVEFEQAVDDDEEQEGAADSAISIWKRLRLNAVEQNERLDGAEPVRQVEDEPQEGLPSRPAFRNRRPGSAR